MIARHWILSFLLIVPCPLLAEEANPAKPTRHVEGELLVKFASEESESQRNSIHSTLRTHLKRKFNFIGWQQVGLPPGMTVEEGIRLYKKQPGVVAAVANEIANIDASEKLPNDPAFIGPANLQWNMRKISAPGAWVGTTGDPDIVVAVLDTGIDYNHPDLAANIWRNPGEIAGNGIDDDGNGYIDDSVGYDFGDNDPNPMDGEGHGTHVAGIIGAVGNNNLGVTGVNWNIKLMPVKVMSGSTGNVTVASVIAGLEYVAEMIDRGVYVRVANHSYSFQSLADTGPLHAAMAALTTDGRNVINVCAAGSGGTDSIGDDNDTVPVYPGNLNIPSLISVAATDSNDQLASFSNYGKTRVHLAAPGVGIYSTSPTALPVNPNYQTYSGTSMAAAHVSGAAALIISFNPSVLTPMQAKTELMATADRLPQLEDKVVTMARLNVRRARWYYDMGEPNVEIATEFSGYRNTLTVLSGYAQEYHSEIAEVRIRLERDGKFWTGSTWKTTTASDPEVQLITTLSHDGGTTWEWSYNQLPTGANLTNSVHVVTAIAEDLPGNLATTSKTFTMDQVVPTLALSNPASGTFTNPLEGKWIGGTAGDNNGPPSVTVRIIRMADGFYWNGVQWTSVVTDLPCVFTAGSQWEPAVPLPEDMEVANGTYSIAVKAMDEAGNIRNSNSNIIVDVNRIYGDTTGNPTNFDLTQFQRPSLTLPSSNPAPSLTYDLPGTTRIKSAEFCIPAPGGGYYTGIRSTELNGISLPQSMLMRHDASGGEVWRLERERYLWSAVGGSQNISEERWSPTDTYYTLGAIDSIQHEFPTTRLDAMVSDSAGNLYAGFIYGSGYLGEGPFCVILKFSPQGKRIWRKSVDGSGFASIKGMELLSDNSVAVLLASANLETPTLARVGSSNDFAIRLTAEGTASRALFMAVDAGDGIQVVSDEYVGTPKETDDSSGYAHTLRKYNASGNLTRTVTVKASKAPEQWTAIKMVKSTGVLYVAGSMMLPGDSYGRVVVSRFDLSRTAGSEQVWRSYAPYPSTTDQTHRGENEDVVQMDCNEGGVVLASVSARPPVFARTGCITKFNNSGVMLWSRHTLHGDTGFNEVYMPRALKMDVAGNVYVGSFHGASNVLAKIAANGDVQFVRSLGDGFGNLQVAKTPMLLLPSAANPATLAVLMKDANLPFSNQSGLYYFANPAIKPVQIEIDPSAKSEIWVNAGGSFQLGGTAVTGTKPIAYQWKKSFNTGWQNVLAASAKQNLLQITNANAAAHSGSYLLEATNIAGVQNSGILKVWVTSPVPLATALDTTSFPWSISGNINWAGQAGGDSRDATDSAMAVATTAGQTASLKSKVTGPGTLSFMWWQTNEYYADFELYIDGIRVKKHNYLQYLQQEVPISGGTHDLEWRFTSVNTSDPDYYPIRAFVDKVSFTTSVVPQVSISTVDTSAEEPSGDTPALNTGRFRITRTGGTGAALAVKYVISSGPGKATLGSDFTLSTAGTATIPAGASFVDVTVTAKYDTLFEGPETATMQLISDAGYSLVSSGIGNVNITDTLQKPYILGRVVDGNGQGIADVKISRSPGTSQVLTNPQGYYCFMALGSGTYVITPSKPGLVFTQSKLSVPVSKANATNQDFMGLTGRSIQGRLMDENGLPLLGAQAIIKKGSTTIATVSVEANGFFGLSNAPAGKYSITPVRKGTKFFPASVTGAVTKSRGWIAEPFLGLSSPYIQGFIGDSNNRPLADVTVKFGKKSVKSNALGFYGFSVLPTGSYTIKPTAAGRKFKPALIKTSVTKQKNSGNNNFKE